MNPRPPYNYACFLFRQIRVPLFWALLLLINNIAIGQQCSIIYTTPSGASSGLAGTKANPASLTYAFSLVNNTTNQIWLAEGTYNISSTLMMTSGVTLEGGFNSSTWIKSNSQSTNINRDNLNMLTNPNRLVGIECSRISNFNIHDITINIENSIGDGTSVYGIHLDSCFSYSITRCEISSGNATSGLPGNTGTNGLNGSAGNNGQQGDPDGSCCTAGGAGGNGSFLGSNPGGNGGNGGSQGTGNCICQGSAPDGSNGQLGNGVGGGGSGVGGDGYCAPVCISTGCDAGPANAGSDGGNGLDGNNGTNGGIGNPLFGSYYTNGDGLIGDSGENGSGGGGGGGGGSQGCLESCLWWNYNGSGAGGGGGGEGGQGGVGAIGGSGGGASFGLYIYNNGANSTLKDCNINSGQQGYGGLGGSPGGYGGTGGGSGQGISSDCDLGDPGEGGNGGSGGNGGNGGNGAPGVSFPIYEHPLSVGIAQSNMKSNVEPSIFIKNTGCTYSDIELYTNATGIIVWYFDGGTMPLSIIGDSATVQYNTTGRHSITLVVDGVPYVFSDIIGIFSDGSLYSPSIISSDSAACPNQTITFLSSISTALFYDWTIWDNGATFHSGSTTSAITHTFSDTGKYEVTLQTTSLCCGKSKIDTIIIDILPILDPSVFVSTNSTAICAGTLASFGATPINGGPSPTYEWFINGLSTGINGNNFASSSFNNGDAIVCTITSDYICPSQPTATSAPITITVFQNPTPSCTASRLYLGAFTEFNAIASGGAMPYTYDWEMGDGGIDTGATALHYYGSTGTYDVTVTVTDSNGCIGTCIQSIEIVLAPYVLAGFTSTTIQGCDSATVSFTDTSLGIPDRWVWDFGDGFSDTIQNPSHTYNSAGTYSVTLVSTNGVYSDTLVMPNLVNVFVSPIVGIGVSDSSGCENLNTQFFDQSSGADDWLWSFGDGATSSTQNPGHNYTDTGTYNVSLIVGSNNLCYDSISFEIDIFPKPIANFYRDSVCATDPMHFIDISTVENGTISDWTWDFGDNISFSNETNPTHSYLEGGTYLTQLIVTSDNNCSDTITDTITVFPKPKSDFVFYPDSGTIINPLETFTDLTMSDSILTWQWSFGDGDSSAIQNPTHLYSDSGIFKVLLQVSDTNGCRDSISKLLTILPDYIFFIPNTFSPNKDGLNEIFKPEIKGVKDIGYHFYVYNKWGDQVFETDNLNVGWDGKINDSDEIGQTDVYVWFILSKDIMGKPHQYTGHVTLLK